MLSGVSALGWVERGIRGLQLRYKVTLISPYIWPHRVNELKGSTLIKGQSLINNLKFPLRVLRHINISFCFVESRAVIDLPEVNIFKHSHSCIKHLPTTEDYGGESPCNAQ